MTRTRNSLVLDGSEVKIRLQASRAARAGLVHVDWLRFTAQRRLAEAPSAGLLFPGQLTPEQFGSSSIWNEEYRAAVLQRLLAEVPDSDFGASAQALQLANDVAERLGRSFAVAPELRKGHDFYRHRWGIEREGVEVGWVGFLASSDSPRQRAQANTLHCNLYGAACTFAEDGWVERVADLIETAEADITRCDLALDFFDGIAGGMDRVQADYVAGLCDVGGKRPKVNQIGDFLTPGASGRSLYLGSKEAGKQTNVYEKGAQLFGPEAGSPWMRAELRYGNKLRELPVDMLRRPDDFFAAASDWHAALLAEAGHQARPADLPCRGRLKLETVEAEVTRALRWFKTTASASAAMLFDHMGDGFLECVTATRLPGRLRGFATDQIAAAFDRIMRPQGASPAPREVAFA